MLGVDWKPWKGDQELEFEALLLLQNLLKEIAQRALPKSSILTPPCFFLRAVRGGVLSSPGRLGEVVWDHPREINIIICVQEQGRDTLRSFKEIWAKGELSGGRLDRSWSCHGS
jgi:hypothetical protein